MTKLQRRSWLLLFLLLSGWMLSGCRIGPADVPPAATEVVETTADGRPTLSTLSSPVPAATVSGTATPPASPTALATPVVAVTESLTGQSHGGEAELFGVAGTPPPWPPPLAPVDPFERPTPTTAEINTAAELYQAIPPERDDVRLAIAYLGAEAPEGSSPELARPLLVGEQARFFVGNIDNNTVKEINANLLAIGDHAYFWFEDGPGSVQPDTVELNAVAAEFDTIYELVSGYFGDPGGPGIDGDPRIHILHASPLSLCSVTLETTGNCGLAGYFTPKNLLPRSVNPTSNEREMFIMNGNHFGGNFYLNVLGHELRHMIEANYDHADTDWEVEGSAMLAEELIGFTGAPWERANLFLSNPDQQLNSWTDSNTIPHYGQGYLFNRYLFDRLGVALYREFATSPEPGLLALDQLAADHNLDRDGLSLWLDWLVAQAVHTLPGAPAIYRFEGAPLDQVAAEEVEGLPTTFDTTVHQYAADYYALPAGEIITVTFSGSPLVPLLDTLPASGNAMWYAQRANYSNPRLTRAVDLRDVEEATLQYAVYADIEQGYDFAYVSISADGGETWRPLVGERMQGLEEIDDPANAAYADRFYTGRARTGRTRQWVDEIIDLSDYAGQEILLRFEYVTDPILTFGGLALDNIAIPEIGFYDDAETAAAGWTAEGFTRATAYLPQEWHLLLVTFEQAMPIVTELEPAADETLSYTLDASNSTQQPILIVAAASPMTLELAHYRLVFE